MSSILESINNWVAGSEPTRVELPGLALRWTGFKGSVSNSLFAGQWLAIPTTEEMREKFQRLPGPPFGSEVVGVFSSTPGEVAPYRSGQEFSLLPEAGQTFLQVSDFEGEGANGPDLALKACREAKGRLMVYLSHHGLIDA